MWWVHDYIAQNFGGMVSWCPKHFDGGKVDGLMGLDIIIKLIIILVYVNYTEVLVRELVQKIKLKQNVDW